MARDQDLIDSALAAQKRAYAPYSNYHVGAAVLVDNVIYQGANIENASYGVTICAERVAISRAVFDGKRSLETLAIATNNQPPVSPCGMCRQFIAEFTAPGKDVRILLVNPSGEVVESSLHQLLPRAFVPKDVGKG